MNSVRLVLRSLRHYGRTNLGVVLGAACASAVLVGALTVGDSVRATLRSQAEARIGRVDAALVAGERDFAADLGDRVAARLESVDAAPILQLRGIVSVPGGAARTGLVDVLGVDGRFFALAPGSGPRPSVPGPRRVALNTRLADHLGVAPGDTVLVRAERPSAMPRDLVMSTVDDVARPMRVVVDSIVDDGGFGRFSLRASQVPPFVVFASLDWLNTELELEGRANALLLGSRGGQEPAEIVADATRVLREVWSLRDASLAFGELAFGGDFELRSDRVFIDAPVADVLARSELPLVGALTYFVNSIRSGERTIPYSTVTAVAPLTAAAPVGPGAALAGLAPVGMGPGGVVLNDWAQRQLGIDTGDPVDFDYYVAGPNNRLVEASQTFELHAVVPIAGAAADPSLMPDFPGLAEAESCRDWEPGIPVELERLSDADQDYWSEHRGTPKAFVTLAAGRAMWQNRFGSLTAIRGPADVRDEVERTILRGLEPADLGLFFSDIRTPALATGTSATDFGGLFLGLSFFLIVAALLLTSLLFVFGVEQRANEIGTLLAVGFTPARVRRGFLAEAAVLALAGGVVGIGFGLLYTRAVLLGLGSLWQDAVGAAAIEYHVDPATVALGAGIAIATALVSIALALRRAFDRPAVELLGSRNGIPPRSLRRPASRISRLLALTAPIAALAVAGFAGTDSARAAPAFFGVGALLLVGGIAGCRLLLDRFARATPDGLVSVAALGLRNSGRRPGRSLATVALLASGVFLVVAIQANRLEPPTDVTARDSGTGGFALFGRTALPVLRDLGSAEGRDAYGLGEAEMAGAWIVPFRVREGDDASCLNLSAPQSPRLVGVRAELLAERAAFRFADVLPDADGRVPDRPWSALDADYGEGVVPAIGDAASVTWALHKGLGDDLLYLDERGREFPVRIVGTVAGSILQGDLVIAESQFEARFPSASGYRAFLVDAPADAVERVEAGLGRALSDVGLELTSTRDRLAAFQAVQNTYLTIFSALGGLGLLLGSLGLGTVVLRNALERRSELAVAAAVGLPDTAIRRLLWSEHALLLGLGLAVGVGAALVAILPSLRASGADLPVGTALWMVAAVAASGALWVSLAGRLATRGPILAALRDD